MTAADLTIGDLRTFGPHRFRATLLATAMEALGGVDDDADRFLDAVDDLARTALERATGAVQVRLWLEPDALVATVSDRERSVVIRTSVDGSVVRLETDADQRT